MSIKYFIPILIATTNIFANDEILITRQAESYFEAGEYERAIELFEKLQKENLESWQEERLLYNIGTSYLKLGEFEKAMKSYDAIEQSSEKPHLLSRPLRTNQAVALYRQAMQLLKSPSPKPEEKEKAVFLLKDCLKMIKKAEEAECRFDMWLGSKNCESATDLFKLKSLAQSYLKTILKKNPNADSLEKTIKNIKFIPSKTEKLTSPKEILEAAIEYQSQALALQRIKHELAKEDEELNEKLLFSQTQAQQLASQFFKAIIVQENKDYPSNCQCEPWDQVIPLFEKGEESAKKAGALIKAKHHMNKVMKNQERSLKFWKEALAKLKPPEKSTPPPQPKQEEVKPLNEILKQLQQMDQDDRRPKPSSTTPKSGLRPW